MFAVALRTKSLVPLVVVCVVAVGCSGGSKVTESPTSSEAADPSTTSVVSVEVSSGDVSLLGSDDFDDGESELFWTGRDDLLNSMVVDGELHVDVVDVSQTQTLRSTWPPLQAVTIESDVAISGHSLGLFTVGCWSGARSYGLAWTGDRGLAVVARIEADPTAETGSSTELKVLSDLGRSSLVRSLGVPFRVRVSCYEEDGVGWISSSIDDVLVALVELPGDVGRFDAVGYAAAVLFEEAGLLIDNVEISEGYPTGIPQPSALPPVVDHSELTVFTHDGLSFEFPSSWEYFTESTPFSELPETWSFPVSPDGVSTVISALSFTEESFAEAGLSSAEFAAEFIPGYVAFQESQGVTLRSNQSIIQVAGRDATLLAFEGIVGDETGLPLVADQVWVFTDSGGYFLYFQVPADDEAEFRPVWERALATLVLPDE
jgi:hypothetical protein